MEQVLNNLIDQYADEMIESVKMLVRMPSLLDESSACENAPFGMAIRKAQDAVMELGETLGFDVRDYDGYATAIRWGNSGEEIGILSHIDVVPTGDGWNTNPFDPVVIDGKMFGRGTIDDKGPMVACLYAMKAIKESGLPVSNRVNHIIGCDEETGHRCIKYYLTKEKCPDAGFSPDGMFSVIHAEKGIIRFRMEKELKDVDTSGLTLVKLTGGTVVNSVPNIAKVWLKGSKEVLAQIEKLHDKYSYEEDMLVLEFNGVSAHAMQPWLGQNAILPMLDFLRALDFSDSSVKDLFQTLFDLFGDGWEGKNLGIACEDQLSGKLSVNLGIMKMEENVCEIKVDVRCPIHISLEMIWKTIRLACQKNEFDAQYWQMRPALYVPKDALLVQKLLDVYNELTESQEEPIVIGGGTYCRDVSNFVTYGPVFPGKPELAHEANEFIELNELVLSAKIYVQALYELMR